MCTIMCYTGRDIECEDIKEALYKTHSRGPDDMKAVELKDGIMGFGRLSIMGLTSDGMQPFTLNGNSVVCNGEIYGYRKIKEQLKSEYSFKSDSDCEILLPLYEKYSVKMFKMLDSEFALVIYDGKKGKFIAARDPIGIRPLYYGYSASQKIMFASEPKCLVGLVDKIFPFPPGHYYEDGKFVCYRDMTAVDKTVSDDLETVCRNIKEKLVAGVKKRLVSDAKVGFLLSGGLDSSLVCAIAAKEQSAPIKTFAIGMEGDAIDLKYAKQVARYIHSDHTEVIMTKEQVIDSLERVIELLATYDITTIRASM